MIDAYHRSDSHSGTGNGGIFDVDGTDPLTAGFDHILGTVGDTHETVFIQSGDIAGIEPALGIQRTGVAAEIALHRPRSAHHQSTGAVAIGRQGFALFIHHLEFYAVLKASLTAPDDIIDSVYSQLGQFGRWGSHHTQGAGFDHALYLANSHPVCCLVSLSHGTGHSGAADNQ